MTRVSVLTSDTVVDLTATTNVASNERPVAFGAGGILVRVALASYIGTLVVLPVMVLVLEALRRTPL